MYKVLARKMDKVMEDAIRKHATLNQITDSVNPMAVFTNFPKYTNDQIAHQLKDLYETRKS